MKAQKNILSLVMLGPCSAYKGPMLGHIFLLACYPEESSHRGKMPKKMPSQQENYKLGPSMGYLEPYVETSWAKNGVFI